MSKTEEQKAIIYYYDIVKAESITTFNNITEIFENLFPEQKTYNFEMQNKHYVFNIIIKKPNIWFGSLSREDDFKESLERIKEKGSGKVVDINNYISEKFTYFLIDCNTKTLSAINNKYIGNLNEFLLHYILINLGFNFLYISPKQIESLTTHLLKMKKIVNVSLIFSDFGINNNQASLKKACGLSSMFCSVNMKLKFAKPKEKNIEELLSLNSNAYKSSKIECINELGIKETIDIIQRSFTKQSTIDYEFINDQNYENILEALKL